MTQPMEYYKPLLTNETPEHFVSNLTDAELLNSELGGVMRQIDVLIMRGLNTEDFKATAQYLHAKQDTLWYSRLRLNVAMRMFKVAVKNCFGLIKGEE